ncbi:MAG: RNA 2',3'-cyclic phosphodiesterase [Acidobacteriota bacterium]|nr:RNA 2',3'-cyclic phosphodiesterase [Acidobacteriota bacterium]
MRVFAAIDLPFAVRSELGRAVADFRAALLNLGGKDSSVRWVNPDGIHLTLKFLGEISESRVQQVTAALAKASSFPSFEIEIRGFGFFPSSKKPRVFWAGIEAPPELRQLASMVDEAMAGLGFPIEKQEYSPHLTLARFKTTPPQPALESIAKDHATRSFGRVEVDSFFLFESRLAAGRPAEYRKLRAFPEAEGNCRQQMA